MRPIASTNLSRFLSPLAIPMPIVSRCIIAGSVKHRARRFLAEVKAKDEGAKETMAAGYHGRCGTKGGSGGEYRSYACAVRSAISQTTGQAARLRLASVVRDILSAIRFGVNVSRLPPGSTESVRARYSELPPAKKPNGEWKKLVTIARRNHQN